METQSLVTPSVKGNRSRQHVSDTLPCVLETDGGTIQYAQQHPARRTMRQIIRAHGGGGESGTATVPNTI